MEVNGYRDLATQKEIHRSLPPPKWSLNCEMGLMGWGGAKNSVYRHGGKVVHESPVFRYPPWATILPATGT